MDLVGRGHEERLTWSAPPLSVCLSTAFFVAALPRQVRLCFQLEATELGVGVDLKFCVEKPVHVDVGSARGTFFWGG